MEDEKTLTWKDYCVTLVILFINITGFILCTRMGETVYNVGSMNAERILADGQYYRLISYMFLHMGIDHIVSNMIFLVGLGQMIEREAGHLRFGMLYMLSGVCAGMVSMLYSALTDKMYSTVGASGAISGLVGALFALVLIHRGNFRHVSTGRILFAAVCMIYSGAIAARADNAAHIGGLAGGALIMTVMKVPEILKLKTGGYRG